LPYHQELSEMIYVTNSFARVEETYLLPPGEKLVCHGGVCSHIPDLKYSRNDSALSRIWEARQNRRDFPLSDTATITGALREIQH